MFGKRSLILPYRQKGEMYIWGDALSSWPSRTRATVCLPSATSLDTCIAACGWSGLLSCPRDNPPRFAPHFFCNEPSLKSFVPRKLHTRIHVYIFWYTPFCIPLYTYINAQLYTYEHVYVHIYTHIHVNTHLYLHYFFTHICIHSYACIFFVCYLKS